MVASGSGETPRTRGEYLEEGRLGDIDVPREFLESLLAFLLLVEVLQFALVMAYRASGQP
jgi:hypothetical protein